MANDPRKVQFTEPVLDLGLDPQMAEQIRRRRPTPAILMIPHQYFSGTPAVAGRYTVNLGPTSNSPIQSSPQTDDPQTYSHEKKVTVCQVKVSKMPSHKEKRRSFPITATMTEILESEFGDDSPDTACCSGQQGRDCPVSEHSLAGKGNETLHEGSS
ncbi:uncharacterized protein [Scyliorhinus torazame]|uniref:uncharacterized protein isoform X1 n=1 Tax=Scyliorhinus torazame TaxID=75743 RepID=UPI003B5B1DE3